jgi:hydroxyacylglutathione hydrolase
MPTITLKISNTLSNFNYLVYCDDTRDCLAIDPLDVDLILNTAHKENLHIKYIVNTHEHKDHTEGNLALKAQTNAKIMAHHHAQHLIPGFDEGLKAGDSLHIGTTIALKILETPGHTQHSICLFDDKIPSLYTGDTLFNCGCGNCHHGGDPEIMFHTFETQLQHLPDETLIYPGHDYIRNNLKFAQSFQPDLSAIRTLENKLSDKDIYISTLGEDKTVNPFFRLNDVKLIEGIHQKTPLSKHPTRKEIFLALRQLRNSW